MGAPATEAARRAASRGTSIAVRQPMTDKPLMFAAALCIAVQLAPAGNFARAEDDEHAGSVFVDPLGLLMFGPRLGIEAGGAHLTGAVYGRWFNEGLLSHSIFLQSGDEFAFSWGVGLRGRYYLSDGQAGFHGGAGLEYLRTRIETPTVLVATVSSYLVPYAEGGYRLAFGRWYLDGSLSLGYAARLSGVTENLPGGSAAASYDASNESSVYGAASLDLGLFF